MAIKQKLARKAVKSTAKHTAHGTASKLKRDRLRTSTLLLAGALVGLLAGWFAGRGNSAAVLQSAPTPS
jgi:F0F1-type ATP synthase assembly protein I